MSIRRIVAVVGLCLFFAVAVASAQESRRSDYFLSACSRNAIAQSESTSKRCLPTESGGAGAERRSSPRCRVKKQLGLVLPGFNAPVARTAAG